MTNIQKFRLLKIVDFVPAPTISNDHKIIVGHKEIIRLFKLVVNVFDEPGSRKKNLRWEKIIIDLSLKQFQWV